ncbi:MAG: hypothetical protein H0V53_11745 [Rubrobacter sp.]|nr:hypothetical protein [Rubrobacter sp.]
MRSLGEWLRENTLRFVLIIVGLLGLNLLLKNLLEGVVGAVVSVLVLAAFAVLAVAYVMAGRSR